MNDFTMKQLLIVTGSCSLLILAALFMLTKGSAAIEVHTIISVVSEQLLGFSSHDFSAIEEVIVWNVRWQRIALALLVGSGLAISGACFQTIFKNPLADPFLLGVSSGAALGAAVSIILQCTQFLIPFAFSGAILSLALVYLVSRQRTIAGAGHHLLLAGIACSALLNALLSASMALNANQIHLIVFWLMGSMTNYMDSLLPLFFLVSAGLAVAMVFARDLDVLALGDEEARFLGVDVNRVKFLLLVSSTLVTGACVSVSGIIGFIGLIVPHMVRRIIGPEHFMLLPLSAIWGALFLLAADSLTRIFPPLSSIPVGVITALFGSPFFLYILYVTGRRRQ